MSFMIYRTFIDHEYHGGVLDTGVKQAARMSLTGHVEL